MPNRERIIYNILSCYCSPAPSTGEFYFINKSGVFNNNFNLNHYNDNNNLINQLDRIQSANYSINFPYTEVKQIGKRSLVSQHFVECPTVQLSLSYLQHGLANETRLGIMCNHNRYETGLPGTPFFNTDVCPISGFVNRSLTRITTPNSFWPYTYQDTRNLFIAVNDGFEDLRKGTSGVDPIFLVGETGEYIVGETGSVYITAEEDYRNRSFDPNSLNYQVYGFGNCYMASYRSEAAVNSLPLATVSYICENVNYYLSGSGIDTPAIDVKYNQGLTGIKLNIPRTLYERGPSVLLPGDITVDIQVTGTSNYVLLVNESGQFFTDELGRFISVGTGEYVSIGGFPPDLGINFNNLTVTNYSLDMTFNRDALNSLGFKRPLDRPINFPVFANLSLNLVLNNLQSGTLYGLTTYNRDYNLELNLKNPCGPINGAHRTAIQYKLRKAKLIGQSWGAQIGQNTTVGLDFSVELDVDDFSKGLFISGLLNVENTSAYYYY